MTHRVRGLEDLAGVTGGELFRMSGLGDLVFGRIADQISSHYLLGFEPRSGENNGKPHKIEITTTRKNVLDSGAADVHSRRREAYGSAAQGWCSKRSCVTSPPTATCHFGRPRTRSATSIRPS